MPRSAKRSVKQVKRPITPEVGEVRAEKVRRFWTAVQTAERIINDKYAGSATGERDVLWVNAIWRLVTQFEMEYSLPSTKQFDEIITSMRDWLPHIEVEFLIDQELHEIERSLEFDDNWRAKATSYVTHIRDVVSSAEMIEALRERILARLNALQGEIDRNRTRVESITEVYLSLTEAVAKGAKHLTPAMRLLERLAGAFSGARTALLGQDVRLRLPPPESMGLIDVPPETDKPNA